MNKEIKAIVKKTAKIAGVTCVAAGAIALMTSGAALKAIAEGGKYLVNTVKKIVNEEPEAEKIVEEAVEVPQEVAQEEVAAQEEAAEEVVAAAEEVIVQGEA